MKGALFLLKWFQPVLWSILCALSDVHMSCLSSCSCLLTLCVYIHIHSHTPLSIGAHIYTRTCVYLHTHIYLKVFFHHIKWQHITRICHNFLISGGWTPENKRGLSAGLMLKIWLVFKSFSLYTGNLCHQQCSELHYGPINLHRANLPSFSLSIPPLLPKLFILDRNIWLANGTNIMQIDLL